MKRPLAISGLGVLAAIGLAVGLATGGSADATIAHGTTGGGHTPVTMCHKPGTPAEQTLVVDDDAVWGHLHHGDHLGTCNPPPPVDVCRNIPGDQAKVPDGKIVDAQGNCVTPPMDVCPNIAGDQGTIPAGLVKDAQGNCVENETETTPTETTPTETTPTETTPPADRCPPGMTPTAGKDGKSGNDECEYPTTTTTDTTPTTATDTTPTITTDTTPTTATDTTPTTTPAAPFTPPTTTTKKKKPAAKQPAATKTAPTTPKKAVAGAFAQEQPKLAYTP